MAWVTTWAWPRAGRYVDSVRSRRSAASCGDARSVGGELAAPVVEAGADRGERLVDRLAGRATLVGVEAAEALLERGQRALLAEQLGRDGPQLVEVGDGARRARGRVAAPG